MPSSVKKRLQEFKFAKHNSHLSVYLYTPTLANKCHHHQIHDTAKLHPIKSAVSINSSGNPYPKTVHQYNTTSCPFRPPPPPIKPFRKAVRPPTITNYTQSDLPPRKLQPLLIYSVTHAQSENLQANAHPLFKFLHVWVNWRHHLALPKCLTDFKSTTELKLINIH